MRKIAVAAMMIGVLTASSAQSQSRDPKEQQRRDAQAIDDQYERATKGSSWATTPKAVKDPWLNVRPSSPAEKK
jgi:hypothetical protein